MATANITRLSWGNKHFLALTQRGNRTLAVLKLKKDNGAQRIPVSLPPEVTLQQVVDAWEAQERQWVEIYLDEGSPYIATRVIWLPQGSIVWHVFHLNDAPSDGCAYNANLTKEAWEATGFGKIVVYEDDEA